MLYKGILQFQLYIPNKLSLFGIKFFSLSKVSEYLWNDFVYLGKEENVSAGKATLMKELALIGLVVPKLVSELISKNIMYT